MRVVSSVCQVTGVRGGHLTFEALTVTLGRTRRQMHAVCSGQEARAETHLGISRASETLRGSPD
eukprot:3462846-Rhodomonas_salina.2